MVMVGRIARWSVWAAMATTWMAAAPAGAAQSDAAPIQRPRAAAGSSPGAGDEQADPSAPEIQRPASQIPQPPPAQPPPPVAPASDAALLPAASDAAALAAASDAAALAAASDAAALAAASDAALAAADVADPVEAGSPPTSRRRSPPPPRPTAVGETGLRSSARPTPRTFEHRGFVTDLRIGTLGCLRGLCGGGHNVRPGFRVDGFVGGNIRGFVDIGVAGGWGQMGSDVEGGTNVLSLYGLDPFLLQQALGVLGGRALDVDLTSLNATGSKLRAAQAGPLVRVHFIPRGRFSAYIGTGVQYNLFRARYDTPGSDTRIDFHGLAVPVEAGFGVHVHEHVAVGVQFDYLWTWYALANLDHGAQALTVPVRILDEAARLQDSSLRSQLPQFWTFGVMLRARV